MKAIVIKLSVQVIFCILEMKPEIPHKHSIQNWKQKIKHVDIQEGVNGLTN